jgi:hypothetical protein
MCTERPLAIGACMEHNIAYFNDEIKLKGMHDEIEGQKGDFEAITQARS